MPSDDSYKIVQDVGDDVVGDIVDGCWTSELELDSSRILGWRFDDLWVESRVLRAQAMTS